MGANEDLIFIGGDFTSLGFETREGFGAYNIFSVNQPPVIETTTSSVAIGGVATINLLDLISDPNNNLDLSSLQVVDGVSQEGHSQPSTLRTNLYSTIRMLLLTE